MEDEYRAKATTFVLNHWAEIEALAEELLKQKTISDPFESDIVIEIARGATAEDLATYRIHRSGAG